jgi:membrane protease YdiL (CAAX protease family)
LTGAGGGTPRPDDEAPPPDRALIPVDAFDAPADPSSPSAPASPATAAASPVPGTRSTSIFSFTLEGRAAPALYVVGWIGTLLGAGLIVVSLMSAGSGAAPWMGLLGLVLLAGGLVGLAGSQATERARRADLPYRGPSPVLAFLAFVAVTLVVQLVALAPLSALGLDPQSPLGTTVNLALQTLVYVGIVALLVVGPGALSWREMGVLPFGAGPARDLLLGAVVAVPVLVVTLTLGGLLSRFVEVAPSPLPPPGNATGLLLNLVSGAVLAPIGEELFFRGFATTAWFRSLGSAAPAIVRGGVFFAFAHVLTQFDSSFAVGAQRALFSFLALLPVALLLGWVFLTRRSLYAAIGLHGTFNAIQVVLAFLVASSLGS